MKSNKKNAAWAAVLASILTVSTISAVAMAAIEEDDLSTLKSDLQTALASIANNDATEQSVTEAVAAATITDGYTAEATSVTITQATSEKAGSIVIAVTFTKTEDESTADVTITLTIAQLDDDTSKDDTSGDDTSKDDTSGDDTSKDDTSGDDTSKDDTSVDSDLSEPDESNSDATIDDVEEKEIDSANNAVEETTTISVTPGTKTTDASGVAITIDADDSTAATFTVTPPAKTTDVQTWVTDTVTTTDSTKVAELNKALSAVADGKAFALDFDLTDENGDPVDLTKPVTVAVPVPDNFKSDINDIKVYHVTADGLVLVESSVEDGAIVFTTTGFSPYIFSTEDLLTAAGPDESGKDNVGTGIALATIPVVIAGAAVVVAARKRKNG